MLKNPKPSPPPLHGVRYGYGSTEARIGYGVGAGSSLATRAWTWLLKREIFREAVLR
jgi:hypothetical protein